MSRTSDLKMGQSEAHREFLHTTRSRGATSREAKPWECKKRGIQVGSLHNFFARSLAEKRDVRCELTMSAVLAPSPLLHPAAELTHSAGGPGRCSAGMPGSQVGAGCAPTVCDPCRVALRSRMKKCTFRAVPISNANGIARDVFVMS